MTLEQAIKEAPFYRLVQRGDTAQETARNLYDFALTHGGLSADVDEGDAIVMGYRAGKCLVAINEATSEVMEQIFDDLGLDAGVAPSKMSDIANLSKDEAKKLFDIVFTAHEIGGMEMDMARILHSITTTRKDAAWLT